MSLSADSCCQNYDDSGCSVTSGTTDALHACLSRNKDSPDKDCNRWGGGLVLPQGRRKNLLAAWALTSDELLASSAAAG